MKLLVEQRLKSSLWINVIKNLADELSQVESLGLVSDKTKKFKLKHEHPGYKEV